MSVVRTLVAMARNVQKNESALKIDVVWLHSEGSTEVSVIKDSHDNGDEIDHRHIRKCLKQIPPHDVVTLLVCG